MKYHLHSLRHFFASWAIAQGFSPKRLQALFGHSSIQMTFDTYGHLLPSLEGDHAKFAAGELQIRTAGGRHKRDASHHPQYPTPPQEHECMNLQQVQTAIGAIDEIAREDLAAGRPVREAAGMISELRRRQVPLPTKNPLSWVRGVRSTIIFNRQGPSAALTADDNPDVDASDV